LPASSFFYFIDVLKSRETKIFGEDNVSTNNNIKRGTAEVTQDTTYTDMPLKATTTRAAPPVPNRAKGSTFSSNQRGSGGPSEISWEISFEELEFGELIGSGAFGDVYKGSWRQITVAIKKLKPSATMGAKLKEFKQEIDLFKKVRPHLNVVGFYGAASTRSKDGPVLCMVMEFLAMGSLRTYLQKDGVVPRKEKLTIIKGIAAGVAHLHHEKIVHRDIAARNIMLQMVDGNLVAKIGDFGLSRFTSSSDSEGHTISNTGPLKWMSLESLKSKVYSTKSDCWAFGVTCWEVLNKSDPYPDMDAFNAPLKCCMKD